MKLLNTFNVGIRSSLTIMRFSNWKILTMVIDQQLFSPACDSCTSTQKLYKTYHMWSFKRQQTKGEGALGRSSRP
jgi:hypothetical protein